MNVGVIGLGHWGPNIVRNFVNHPRVRLTYVSDISELAFQRVEKMLPSSCLCVTDASEAINNKNVDALAIVTPLSTHYELVKECLLARKHVFCEKPLTASVSESRELCAIAEKNGCRLMVGYTFLFNNGIKKMKNLIDNNLLGKLFYLTANRTHMGPIRQDTNVLWDLAPHDISIMNYLLESTPKKVSAVGAKPLGSGRFDVAFITLFYQDSLVGQIHVSWIKSNKERLLNIIGSKAIATFNDLNSLEPVRIFNKGTGTTNEIKSDFGEFRFLLRDGDIISPKVEMEEPLSQMVDAFVKLIMDGKENIASGKYDLDVTRVLEAAQKSMDLGGPSQDVI